MFLIDRFQQFHGEMLRLTKQVEDGNWVFDPATAGTPEAVAEAAPSAVWRRLLSLLERQELEASREGGDFAVELFRRAKYAMAALADEVFLNLPWAGREAWREHLLENRLFGTHRAGEEMFERIEVLLRDRDSAYGELARLYLIVLALGFQGKYRGSPEAERELEDYRRRLFQFIFSRDPRTVRGEEQVVPQAYAATLDEAHPSELPHLKPWLWAIAMVVLLWIAAGHLIWSDATAKLQSSAGLPAGALR
jgi:type VI secretion system protein ImpK